MYEFYLDNMLLPVAPSKLSIKINNNNKTLNLINDGEINILKNAGLTTISFDFLLPNVRYPFAMYKSGFEMASSFLSKLEQLKVSKKPFQFIVTRSFEDGRNLNNTNITVGIEDYTIKEDANKLGFDTEVSINLKQYKSYGTKVVTLNTPTNASESTSTNEITVTNKRASDPLEITIGSNVILNGTLHRDSFGNGPGQSKTNFNGKVNFINLSGSHPYHITTLDGGWLGWVSKDSVRGV